MDRARRWFLLTLSSLFSIAQMPRGRKGPLAWLAITSTITSTLTVSTDGTTARQGARLDRWQLTWGDGAVESGSGKPPLTKSHRYLAEGTYSVRLVVWDSRGLSAEAMVAGKIVFRNSLAEQSGGCDITAATGSSADVQAAFDAATTGQTVCIPAGTFTWTEAVTLSKSIEVVGAMGRGTKTQCEVGGQTTFTCIKGNRQLLQWDTPSTGTPRLAGISFYGESCSDCSGAYGGAHVNIFGSNGQFRLHDVVIDTGGASYTGLIVSEYVRGVGWNNDFIQRAQTDHAVLVLHQSWLDTGNNGDKSWAEASSIGTADAWYWEDNTFGISGFASVGFCTDDFMGARVVYRFNQATNCSFQNHGTETGGRLRGHREVDYHRNIATNDLQAWPGAFAYRGGTGYGWGNTFTTSGSGSFTKTLEGTTFRRDDTSHGDGSWYPWGGCGEQTLTSITRSGSTATVTLSGHKVSCSGSYVIISGADQSEYNGTFFATKTATAPCDQQASVTFTYTVSGTPATPATGTIKVTSPFDGNLDATGRPCLDGFGTGQNPYVTGDAPPFGDITPLTGFGATLQPVYGWLNRLNGSQTDTTASMDFVQANRELYNENSSFTGATGIGVGPIASRPATCTTGVAYWATDEGSWNSETSAEHANHGSNHSLNESGKRYECTATNTWTAKYGASSTGEPYAYPHPLRGL